MTDAQRQAREHIISKEELPPQYDMVIINASSETGINIYGKVDYIVVHNDSEETQIQIRGRYRQDLDRLYLYDKNAINVPEEFLDRKLFAPDKQELCEAVNIRDKKGKRYNWNTVKDRIEQAGYSVVSGREKNKRYEIITL